MNQLIIHKGKAKLIQLPNPKVKNGKVLIRSTFSLISLGTERIGLELSKQSLLTKAKNNPDKLKKIFDKINNIGIRNTISEIINRLNSVSELGYSNVGVIEEVGEGVTEFKKGDRVVSNGFHAEFVCVSVNLVSKIPDNVSDKHAVFTVVGSIGLQGIRLLNPTFGETIVVIGLGLIGLITAELLIANGCNVIGIDLESTKIKIAKKKGINTINALEVDDQVKYVNSLTDGIGADGVIITASSNSDKIISHSAQMCRKRGRIILVGVIGLNLPREEFYQKEITFQVSCSYGPGRYDENYELYGNDYPIGYVRWTEKRNFESVLAAMSKGQINVEPLISNIVDFNDCPNFYNKINDLQFIGCIIKYDSKIKKKSTIIVNKKNIKKYKNKIGIIGSGNFTKSMILPILKKINADIYYLASSNGLTSTILSKQYKIIKSTTDYNNILKDKNVDLVIITTRHDSHSKIVLDSIDAGKNIFVEKPLTIKESDLKNIISKYNNSNINITVGFNRRFSPLTIKTKSLLENNNDPLNIVITINAGYIPSDSWVQDPKIGGGRIIGEACHFIDLSSFIVGAKITEVCMNSIKGNTYSSSDSSSILLKFFDGSNAVINYFSNGSNSYPKERIEIHSDQKTIIIDDWKTLYGFGFNNFSKKTYTKDKGHLNQFKKLLDSQKKGDGAIIPFDEIINSTKATFSAIKSFKKNKWVIIN